MGFRRSALWRRARCGSGLIVLVRIMNQSSRYRRTATALALAAIGGTATGIILPDPALAQAPARPIDTPQGQGAPPDPPTAPQTPPPTIFQDRDGNPLPPEIQHELQERLRDQLRSAPEQPISDDPPTDPQITARPADPNGDILVEAQRPRGSVIATDIPPERTFDTADLRAYGASNVAELLQALGSQVGGVGRGDGGAPITLLNGRRVSNFAEIADIPSEAIERVEVFPEELALRYGFRPEQKVVNIVTRERFDSILGQLGGIAPTDGGYATGSFRANYFAIRNDTRFDLTADYNLSSSLLESERDLDQLDDQPDAGRFRTLLPSLERLALSGLVGGNPLDGLSATLNGRYEITDLLGLRGLNATDVQDRATTITLARAGTTLRGRVQDWQWTVTGQYEVRSTDVLNSGIGAREEAQSQDSLAEAVLLLNGPILQLPAGPLSTAIRLGGELRDFDGESRLDGVERFSNLTRDTGSAQANITLPLSRRTGPGASSIGSLSVNATAEVRTLSDAGTLTSYGAGLTWAPSEAISFVASMSREVAAPTLEQLGEPLLMTPNLRVFDFIRGEQVDIVQLSGGNPDLTPEERRVIRVTFTARPFGNANAVLSADFLDIRLQEPILPFPLVTPPLEAAFPERFTRDFGNRLQQIDARPLNVAAGRQQLLRWGFSLTRQLGAADPWLSTARQQSFANEADARAAAPPGAIVSVVPPDSALARRFENLSSRLFVSLFHNWRLRDDISLRDGQPPLDLLDGAALDVQGRRRHSVALQAGIFRRGLGARVSAEWQSGATLRGANGAAGDVIFADFATISINMFANLQQQFGGEAAPAWLHGARISFSITNLFGNRPEVRSATDSIPLIFQRDFLDPLGRTIGLTVRRVF